MGTYRNGTTASSVGSNLDNKLDALKTRVVEVKDQAKAKSTAVIDNVTSLIKANPLKAVGIAFAVGFIGMRLLRR